MFGWSIKNRLTLIIARFKAQPVHTEKNPNGEIRGQISTVK
ncbi:MAG TPA: CHRD domain-containing protein [Nitrososphaeraceae archaeon]